MLAWFWAFLFTQVIECPIYLVAMRRHPASFGRKAAVAFGASSLTHPIVWFVIPPLVYQGCPGDDMRCYVLMVAIAETFAVVAEAFYVRAFDLRRPFLWSFVANAASAGLGFLSRELVGFP